MTDEAELLDAAQKKLDKAIQKYVDLIPAHVQKLGGELRENGRLETRGDCWYCVGMVSTLAADGAVQASSEDVSHLQQHLQDSYLMPTLYLRAVEHAKYADPAQALLRFISTGSADPIQVVVKRYLKAKLGNLPARAQDDSLLHDAKESVEKPDDYGYFGHDERLYVSSAPSWTHVINSGDPVDQANWEYVLQQVKSMFPELWLDNEPVAGDLFPHIYEMREKHWAVGPMDRLVIPVLIDHDGGFTVENIHSAFVLLRGFALAARVYPVLDEETHARVVYEQELHCVEEYMGAGADEDAVKRVRAEIIKRHGDVGNALSEQIDEILYDLDLYTFDSTDG